MRLHQALSSALSDSGFGAPSIQPSKKLPITRSPILNRVTFSPTATISPAPSDIFSSMLATSYGFRMLPVRFDSVCERENSEQRDNDCKNCH